MRRAPADVDSVRARLGGTAYPRKAMDHQGTTVKLAAPAKRIVSLSNATDEYLYQIVPAERIVGVTKSAYDAEFSAVLDKVKVSHPAVVKDVESILKLKPHLVLTADSMSLQLGDGLRDAGIPVFGLFTNVTKLDQVAANIAVVGYVTGEDEGARKELDRFQREIAQIEAQCKAPHPPAKIYGVSMTGFTYGDQTLFQDVMRITGGTNIAAVNGMHTYDKVDRAMVTSWNPEWVFTWAVPGKQSEELHRWMDDPGLGSTTAAKNHRINVSVAKDVLPLSSLVTTFAHTIANATCAN
ncbi:MAG: ABC transporter substrate-binding protein [Acidobacteriota bacterium]